MGHAVWGDQEHLLATAVDILVGQTWQYAQAHSKKIIPKPEPVRRPGAKVSERKTTLTPAQIAERLRAQRRTP